jgi:hypothetical protein
MRYRKGSIVISETHDVPLLLLVRNAGYITHEQLIALSGYDKSQSSVCNFLWRIRRLLAGGFAALLHQRIEGHKVYSITRKGLAELESFGHMLYSLNPETASIGRPSKMMHCLELNDIRLTLKRHRLLDSWLSDIEVCSENLLTEDQYVKDYDALAVLRVGDRRLHCAIEYERTTKSLARYAEIRQALSQERTLNAILYIVREVERLFLVAEQLTGAHPGILFVTASAFLRFGPDAYAMRSHSVGGTLEDLLVQLAPEVHPVDLPSPHNWPIP